MKNIKFLTLALISILSFNACSSDDDTLPTPVNEEEIITTVNVTLTPQGTEGTVITLQKQDLDGDGPNAPTFNVSGDLIAGVIYDGTIELLNETDNPAEDITEEVEEESDDHQFFYTLNGGLDLTTTYTNFDNDGNNLGTEFILEAGAVSNGTLTFTLRHEPTKPNTGLSDAGGETDVEATFSLNIL